MLYTVRSPEPRSLPYNAAAENRRPAPAVFQPSPLTPRINHPLTTIHHHPIGSSPERVNLKLARKFTPLYGCLTFPSKNRYFSQFKSINSPIEFLKHIDIKRIFWKILCFVFQDFSAVMPYPVWLFFCLWFFVLIGVVWRGDVQGADQSYSTGSSNRSQEANQQMKPATANGP